MWLDNLNWKQSSEWIDTIKQPLDINMVIEGYVKQVGNLVFYTVLRAGHSVRKTFFESRVQFVKHDTF